MSMLSSICLSFLAWPTAIAFRSAPTLQDPLLGAVPKEALVCVSVRDIDGLRASWQENAWHKFFADEAFAPLREQLQSLMEDASKEAEFELDEALDALHGSMVGFMMMSGDDATMGYLIDPGSSAEKARSLYKKAIGSPSLQRESRTETYKGVALHFATMPDRARTEAAAIAAEATELPGGTREESPEAAAKPAQVVGDPLVVFDTGRVLGFLFGSQSVDLVPSVHGLIDRLQGNDTNASLASSPRFADARKSVSTPGRIELYVDARNIYEMALRESTDNPDEKRIMDLLGLEQLTFAYATADIGTGEKAWFEAALHVPEKGYLRSFLNCLGRYPRELARNMPGDSMNVNFYGLDLPKLWATAWSFVKEVDPEAHDEARGQLTGASGMFGDVEHEVLLQLTGRFGMCSSPVPAAEWTQANLAGVVDAAATPEGTLYGETYMIEIADTSVFSTALTRVLTATGMAEQLQTEDYQGTPISKFGDADGPVSVEWAFRPKLAFVSMYPSALRAALRASAGEPKDTALENPLFKPLFDSRADAHFLSLANTGAMMRGTLDMFGTLGVFMSMSLDGSWPALPKGEIAGRYFKGTAISSVRLKGNTLTAETSMR